MSAWASWLNCMTSQLVWLWCITTIATGIPLLKYAHSQHNGLMPSCIKTPSLTWYVLEYDLVVLLTPLAKNQDKNCRPVSMTAGMCNQIIAYTSSLNIYRELVWPWMYSTCTFNCPHIVIVSICSCTWAFWDNAIMLTRDMVTILAYNLRTNFIRKDDCCNRWNIWH